MITEDYVSFKTAKLLKEKGFYGECFSMYLTPKPHSGMGNPNEAKLAPHGRDNHYYDGYLYQCEAPTLQMVMKWLREKHNIVFGINPNDHEGVIKWRVEVYKVYGQNGCLLHEGKWIAIAFLPSYEEAAEAAIKYCLENLV